MRIVTNEALIQKNRRTATTLFFVSMAVLIFGFFVANGQFLGMVSEESTATIFALITPLVLLVGFATTMTSVRMTNLWVRLPRPEVVIPEGLKGLSHKAALYNYHHLPARHIIVTPQGIFPLITRFQEGKYSVKGDKWRSFRGFLGVIFTFLRLDGIGNPFQDVEIVKRYVEFLIEDYDKTLPIYPIVVFVDPRAKVTIEDPKYPVVYADAKKSPNLKEHLKSYGNDTIPQFQGDGYQKFLDEWEASTLD